MADGKRQDYYGFSGKKAEYDQPADHGRREAPQRRPSREPPMRPVPGPKPASPGPQHRPNSGYAGPPRPDQPPPGWAGHRAVETRQPRRPQPLGGSTPAVDATTAQLQAFAARHQQRRARAGGSALSRSDGARMPSTTAAPAIPAAPGGAGRSGRGGGRGAVDPLCISDYTRGAGGRMRSVGGGRGETRGSHSARRAERVGDHHSDRGGGGGGKMAEAGGWRGADFGDDDDEGQDSLSMTLRRGRGGDSMSDMRAAAAQARQQMEERGGEGGGKRREGDGGLSARFRDLQVDSSHQQGGKLSEDGPDRSPGRSGRFAGLTVDVSPSSSTTSANEDSGSGGKPQLQIALDGSSQSKPSPGTEATQVVAGGDGDALAQTYTFSESGSFNIQGFEIRESGITQTPDASRALSSSDHMKANLIKLCMLGKGASGVVYKAVHAPTLRLVAVKSIPVFDQNKRHQMVRELSALYANFVPLTGAGASTARGGWAPAPCPHVVSFVDAFLNPEEGNVSMVVEYMDGGSLQDIVDTGGCDAESVLANIAYRVLLGLEFIHSRHQIHRDIKPSNLLINHQGDVKISDFGIVREMEHTAEEANTFVGTLTYMSPERISGDSYSAVSDIWSFGLTLLTCCLGKFPIATTGGYWGLLHALKEQPAPSLPHDQYFSDEFRDFIDLTLQKDPRDRPSASQLLRHPFLEGCCVDPPGSEEEEDCGEGSDTARGELEDICDRVLDHQFRNIVAQHQRAMQLQLHSLRPPPMSLPPPNDGKLRNLARQLGLSSMVVKRRYALGVNEANDALHRYLTQLYGGSDTSSGGRSEGGASSARK